MADFVGSHFSAYCLPGVSHHHGIHVLEETQGKDDSYHVLDQLYVLFACVEFHLMNFVTGFRVRGFYYCLLPVNMVRACVDPFWTMNYVPAVLGAFLYGNPNNFVIGNLFWFAYIFLDLVAKGNLSPRISKVARYLLYFQTVMVVIGEVVCLILVGVDLHLIAWRFFPLWAGSILIIPMVFYSVRRLLWEPSERLSTPKVMAMYLTRDFAIQVVLIRLYREIMKTLQLTNAHSASNNKSLKLARRIKLLGLFQTPLLIASFAMVGLRGVVPVLFGWWWSAWIWHLFVQFSGLMFHGLAYGFWLAKLRGWSSPFEKNSSSSKTGSTASGGSGSRSSDSPSRSASPQMPRKA